MQMNILLIPRVAMSAMLLSATAQAANQTYVIDTYGGDALLPAVRQQLNNSRDGGTATTYQGKLVLQTTPANYQAVQQLLSQIDRQPQALIVAVRVGNSTNAQSNIKQGQVIISDRGVQGAGIIHQQRNQQRNNSLYQVQTLSGSTASISTNTLYSLTQNYRISGHSTYKRPSGQIIIQQQVLLPTIQGIAVTPRVLTDGQIKVQLSQVEEKRVKSNSTANAKYYPQNSSIQGQRLNSTIIVPRGQWMTIGQLSQYSQRQSSGYSGSRNSVTSNSTPIQLMVQ